MSRAIEGSPDALVAAARVLAAQDGSVRDQARRLGAAAHVAGWEGAAALGCAVRTGEAQVALTAEAGRLGDLARATTAYAERLRTAQRQADLLRGRQEQALAQIDRLDRAPCQRVTDPAQESRRASLAREVAVLQGRLGALAESAELDGRSLARVLAVDPTSLLPGWMLTVDPTTVVPGWALGAWAARTAVTDGRTTAAHGRLVGSIARDVARAKLALAGGNVTEWLAHLDKADRAVEELRHGSAEPSRLVRHLPPRIGALVAAGQRVAARAFLPLTVKDGVTDVVTGGGYHDWREPVTRVMGGVGAASALTLMVVGSGGTLAAVAGAALVAYSAWKLGNTVWDHRREIAEFGKSTWRLAQAGARAQARVTTWATQRALDTVRSAGRLGQTVARGVGDRVGRVVRSIHLPHLPWPSFGF